MALSSDGADEVFGGYNKHRALLMSLNPFIEGCSPAYATLEYRSASRGSSLKIKLGSFIDLALV